MGWRNADRRVLADFQRERGGAPRSFAHRDHHRERRLRYRGACRARSRSRRAFSTSAARHLVESIARAAWLRPGKRGDEGGAAVHRSPRSRRRSREHRARAAAHRRHAAMTTSDLLDRARELNARSAPYALVTVVRAVAPTSAYLG